MQRRACRQQPRATSVPEAVDQRLCHGVAQAARWIVEEGGVVAGDFGSQLRVRHHLHSAFQAADGNGDVGLEEGEGEVRLNGEHQIEAKVADLPRDR